MQSRPVRLPAQEIETSICRELAAYLLDPIKLIDDLGVTNCPQEMQVCARETATEMATMLNTPNKQAIDNTVMQKLVQQVKLLPDMNGYTLIIDLLELAETLNLPNTPVMETVEIPISLELRVCNNGKKVIIGNKPANTASPNTSLINALKTAHQIKRQYMGAKPLSLTAIATTINMNKRQVWRNLKLAFLAPDIQLSILSGTQPRGLCIQDLLDTQMPIEWAAQRTVLGFA